MSVQGRGPFPALLSVSEAVLALPPRLGMARVQGLTARWGPNLATTSSPSRENGENQKLMSVAECQAIVILAGCLAWIHASIPL
jgi:hypothetical protein